MTILRRIRMMINGSTCQHYARFAVFQHQIVVTPFWVLIFSYEDIKLETRVSTTDYHYKTIGEGNIGGHHCFKIEGTPKNQKIAKELGYSKTESCIDDKIWMSRQTKSWDLTGKPLKNHTK